MRGRSEDTGSKSFLGNRLQGRSFRVDVKYVYFTGCLNRQQFWH